MTVAASGPWPITSPTISPVRSPGSGMMSYQSPPASVPAAGRHRPAISSCPGATRLTARRGGARTSATDRRRISASEPASPAPARRARSAAACVSASPNAGAAGARARTRKPAVVPRMIIGAARNDVKPARAVLVLGLSRRSVAPSGWAKVTGAPSLRQRANGESAASASTCPGGKASSAGSSPLPAVPPASLRTTSAADAEAAVRPAGLPLSSSSRTKMPAASAKPGITACRTRRARRAGSGVASGRLSRGGSRYSAGPSPPLAVMSWSLTLGSGYAATRTRRSNRRKTASRAGKL